MQYKSVSNTVIHEGSFQKQAKTRPRAVFPFSAVGGVMRVGVGLSDLSRVFRNIVGRGFMIAGHV